ncbi:MAG TPA: hypothetical protein VF708_20025 [Pyrinomonadaceae bacterium]|jgi:hypothetical protein
MAEQKAHIETDRATRLAISHGMQPVGTGNKLVRWEDFPSGDTVQKSFESFLGMGPWEEQVAGYYDGYILDPADLAFHPGNEIDLPDQFTGQTASAGLRHPRVAYQRGRLKPGQAADNRPDAYVGIYKTLKTADYNGAGEQIDQNGVLVPASGNPLDYFFYKPNAANVVADYVLRWFKRGRARINWPVWVDWRDWNDEPLFWDNGSNTPTNITIGIIADEGELPAGDYNAIRIAAYKGADVTSASDPASVTIEGFGTGSLEISWGEVEGVDGYRVWINSNKYFTVVGQGNTTITITTLTGALTGAPPTHATGALRTQVRRFESHLFMLPPFRLGDVLLRIAQVSCMKFQDVDGRLSFFAPVNRAPIFTYDMTEIERRSFRTWQIDRRERPREITVVYRNLDDPLLPVADPPVSIKRDNLHGQPFIIDAGTCNRGQAERIGNYWARRLCDSDTVAEANIGPRSFIAVPCDVISFTHTETQWENVRFEILQKEEHGDRSLTDHVKLQTSPLNLYSDTSSAASPRPFPATRNNPYLPPPAVVSADRTEVGVTGPDGTLDTAIRVDVLFRRYGGLGGQRGRIFYKKSTEADALYKLAGLITPDPVSLTGSLNIRGVDLLTYNIKVVTESPYASDPATATTILPPITITGSAAPPSTPVELRLDYDRTTSIANSWVVLDWDPVPDREPGLVYVLYKVVAGVEIWMWQGKLTSWQFHPLAGDTTIDLRLYTKLGNIRSAGYASATVTVVPLAAPVTYTVTFTGRARVHKAAKVTNMVGYRITKDNGANAPGALVAVVMTTEALLWTDEHQEDDARVQKYWVQVIDRWGNYGAGRSYTSSVPVPGKPTVVPGTPVRGLTPVAITPHATTIVAAITMTAIKWGSDLAVTKNVKEVQLGGDVRKYNVPPIAGFSKVYVKAAHRDPFGWGIYG